ncbi:MAG TPA: hypothetical protein VEG39_02180 [Clostridia bacterium]|nr:hypothetical protein [Clostridia bacterium]
MEELLGKILNELKDLKNNQNKTNEKLETIDSRLGNVESRLGNVESRLGNVESDVHIMKTQLKEHGQILSSLQKASEFHKADIDNLTSQVAHLSGEMKSGFDELRETNRSLFEMYGYHEAEISKLRRRPV